METDFALIEAETAGVVMEPGAEVAERNTRLQAIVEQVFSEIAPEKAAHVARQAEEGLLTLEELDRMADEAGSVTAGALKLIFGPISPAEVLLEFVASDTYDKKIAEKKAQGELVTLASDELEGALRLWAPELALLYVVVDHSQCLHERVDRRRADERPASLPQVLAQRG